MNEPMTPDPTPEGLPTTEAGRTHDADWRNLLRLIEAAGKEYGDRSGPVMPLMETLQRAHDILVENVSGRPSLAIEQEAITNFKASLIGSETIVSLASYQRLVADAEATALVQAELAQLRSQIAALEACVGPSGEYETRISRMLDNNLPPHSEKCDEGWTSHACLRCDVLSGAQVSFGFARPLFLSDPAKAASEWRDKVEAEAEERWESGHEAYVVTWPVLAEPDGHDETDEVVMVPVPAYRRVAADAVAQERERLRGEMRLLEKHHQDHGAWGLAGGVNSAAALLTPEVPAAQGESEPVR